VAYLDKWFECNPLAKAKRHADNKCLCTPPYTGSLCEDCISGFKAERKELRLGPHDTKTHTLCVPVAGSDEVMCNNYGRYDRGTSKCVCRAGFAGDYCEVCANPQFEYPDCSGAFDASLMDSSAYNAWN